MFRLLAGAIAVAWALAGWRNMPRLEHPQATAAGLAIGGTVWIAYWLGAKQTSATANASAWAKAEARAAAIAASTSAAAATSNVNVVFAPELGARMAGEARLTGLESAPWMVGATRDAELEQDFLVQALEDGQGDQESEYA